MKLKNADFYLCMFGMCKIWKKVLKKITIGPLVQKNTSQ